MIQKKYQVFISSTYTDLVEERKKVQEILLRADCIPAGMEAFVATNDEQFEVIKKVINLCDYYVLIIGKRYGSINQITGISYTEMEYDYAVSRGIPVLVFAIDEHVELSQDKIESDKEIVAKLKDFRSKALTNRLASIWKDEGDLAGKVAIAIMKAKEEISRPGWLRGDEFISEELLIKFSKTQEENKLLTEKNNELQNKIEELSVVNEELEFEDRLIRIDFRDTKGKEYYRNMCIRDIFANVSLFMTGEPLFENELEDLICQAVSGTKYIFFTDRTFCKRMSLQFVALKLLNSYVGDGGNVIFYKLTSKGLKMREELNTFKKQTN